MSVHAEAQSASFDSNPDGSASGGVERRTRLHNTIESLVRLRQEVVVSYCQLAGVSSRATAKLLPNHGRLHSDGAL